MKKRRKVTDPFSRILLTSDDGEIVRVYFDIPREVFETIVDLSSLYNFDIDRALSEAVIDYARKVLGVKREVEILDREREPESVDELKITLEKLTGMIKELSMKVSQFQQLARDLSTGRIQPELIQQGPVRKITLDSIEIPELKEVTSEEAKVEDVERAPLEAVLEDVLVVAVDEELLEEEKEEKEEE